VHIIRTTEVDAATSPILWAKPFKMK